MKEKVLKYLRDEAEDKYKVCAILVYNDDLELLTGRIHKSKIEFFFDRYNILSFSKPMDQNYCHPVIIM